MAKATNPINFILEGLCIGEHNEMPVYDLKHLGGALYVFEYSVRKYAGYNHGHKKLFSISYNNTVLIEAHYPAANPDTTSEYILLCRVNGYTDLPYHEFPDPYFRIYIPSGYKKLELDVDLLVDICKKLLTPDQISDITRIPMSSEDAQNLSNLFTVCDHLKRGKDAREKSTLKSTIQEIYKLLDKYDKGVNLGSKFKLSY